MDVLSYTCPVIRQTQDGSHFLSTNKGRFLMLDRAGPIYQGCKALFTGIVFYELPITKRLLQTIQVKRYNHSVAFFVVENNRAKVNACVPVAIGMDNRIHMISLMMAGIKKLASTHKPGQKN